MFRIFCIILLFINAAYGMLSPRPISGDNRIKVITYMPNSVFKLTMHYTYQTILELAIDEKIETISVGSPSAWQVQPVVNRIFIKPIDDDADTNMTVITNKRMYFFELHAEESEGVSDPNISFVIKFLYPDFIEYESDSIDDENSNKSQFSQDREYNFNYAVSGKALHIEPLQVFDDGKFTYFKFKEKMAEIPAIFIVYSDNSEGIVNYRVSNGYVVVERLARRYTLRSGKDAICVFNEAYNR